MSEIEPREKPPQSPSPTPTQSPAPAQPSPAAGARGPSTPPPAPPAPPARGGNRALLYAIAACVLLIVVIGYFLLPDLFAKETDDAYVDAHVVSVISKLPAYVQKLYVDDNSHVTAGQLLVELDPRDYAVQLQQAQAQLGNAQSRLQDALNQIPVADAEVARERAELEVAQSNAGLASVSLRRLQSVSDIRAVSSQRVDEGKAAASGTQAAVTAAQVRIVAAQAQAKLVRSQAQTAQTTVDEARALLAQANLNLSYTKIYATETGSVARKSVETGNYVQPGQLLLTVVPEKLYVIANYKETQLTHVRPGQSATIRVDAFPDVRLRGHVDSIQRGTGSRFALLPPENATGNFVKVVQRVPVKIVFDAPPDVYIGPGMSVVPTVKVR
jgi:membrane fusion protein, multidrug efflux system